MFSVARVNRIDGFLVTAGRPIDDQTTYTFISFRDYRDRVHVAWQYGEHTVIMKNYCEIIPNRSYMSSRQ